jgi:hypothetical protein
MWRAVCAKTAIAVHGERQGERAETIGTVKVQS